MLPHIFNWTHLRRLIILVVLGAGLRRLLHHLSLILIMPLVVSSTRTLVLHSCLVLTYQTGWLQGL